MDKEKLQQFGRGTGEVAAWVYYVTHAVRLLIDLVRLAAGPWL